MFYEHYKEKLICNHKNNQLKIKTSHERIEMASLFLIIITSILFGPLILLVGKLVYAIQKARNIGKYVDKFPGPPKHWLFGNLHQLKGTGEDSLKLGKDLASKYVRVYRLWFGPWHPCIRLVHPDTMKLFMKTNEPKQRQFGAGYSLLVPWLGEGLLVANGNRWFRNRKLLTNAFHFDILKPYVNIYNKSAEEFLKCLDEGMKTDGKSVDIAPLVSLATLDIMLKCAFSYEEQIQTQKLSNPYVKAVKDISALILDRAFKPWLHVDFIYLLTKNGRQFFKNCEYVHKFADEIIEKRKKNLTTEQSTPISDAGRKKHLDFLDILLTAKDEDGNGLTPLEIRSEVDTFLFEGHDTTASCLLWCLYNLASQQEIQEKVRKEVHDVLVGRTNSDILWGDLSKLEYLTMCIKETQRLQTTVPYIGREITKEFEIDGLRLLPGTFVDFCIYEMNHNPHVWENPEEFLPERFQTHSDDSYKFVPFSAGPRNCIGQNFAMNELKVTLAKVVSRFHLEIDSDHKIERCWDVVFRSKTGIRLKLKTL